jgi:tetratricopeptide (TPR) repeat protein
VVRNDEALGILINLKTFAGKADESIKLLQSRTFSIWEGATPFSTGQAWIDAHLVRGLQFLRLKKYSDALADFEAALNPPENLRAEQRRGSSDNGIAYWTGCAYEGSGEKEKAQKSWNEAAAASTPNGGQNRMGRSPFLRGEQSYYQALAKKKLGNKEGTDAVFNELVTASTKALNQPENAGADVSQPFGDGQSRINATMAHYNAGLGYSGLGNKVKAKEEFDAALKLQPDYLNARVALDQLNALVP